MERRSFFKMIVGAIAAIPLAKLLSKSEPIITETPAIKKFMAGHAAPQRIDILAIEHWGRGGMRPVDLDHTLGAGALDTVRDINGRSIQANSGIFYRGQYVRIFSSGLKYLRGTRRIQAAHNGWITFDSKLPGDTQQGDLLLIEDTLLPFCAWDSKIGEWKGLNRHV